MYRVTRALSVGPFLTADRLFDARRLGVTHVFNVSGSDHVVARDGFAGFAWESLSDARRIPEHQLPAILTTLHDFASQPGANVYVHCVAGQVRSPAVLFLYLVALGLPPDDAREWIETASPVAMPGHPRLVDAGLITFAQKYGGAFLTPLPRPEILHRA